MSTSPHWQCTRCRAILVKGIPPEVAGMFKGMIGTGTCTNCGAQYSQQEIYSGALDVNVANAGHPSTQVRQKTKYFGVVILLIMMAGLIASVWYFS